MIIFAKSKLKWVPYEDLPMDCYFVSRMMDAVYKKEHPQMYKPKGIYVRAPENISGFAQVKILQCAIAVFDE